MVEFQEDADERTQGTGKFDLSVVSGRAIDPPPHDRPYFEAKLTFVQNYFRRVSNGKLEITGDILPSVVTVSQEMSAYSQDNEPEFSGEHVDKLVFRAMDTQTSAINAMKALGFVKEAVLKEHVVDLHGRTHDLVIMTNYVAELWRKMEDLILDTEFEVIP